MKNAESVAQIYNGLKDGYRTRREAQWSSIGFLPETALLKLIRNRFRTNNAFRLFDVGCGYGADLKAVKSALRSDPDFKAEVLCYGNDLSSWMAEETQKAGFDCRQGDFMDINEQTETFDFVWCNMCLMHFPLMETPGAVVKLKSFLSDGGVLGIGIKTLLTPDDNELGKEVINPAHGSITVDRLMSYFNEIQFRSLLMANGLKFLTQVTESSGDGEYNYTWFFATKEKPA